MYQQLFTNPILLTDGYKVSHWRQLPPGMTNMYSYQESRGGKFAEIVPFGLKYYIQQYLMRPITMEHIEEAEPIISRYFNDATMFNRAGFERIVTKHGGYWPLRIKAVPEGIPIPAHNVMMTVENTDPKLPWVTNYPETLLSLTWFPTTVCTLSREIKKIILASLERTGTPESIEYKLHDFGMRGTSSIESGAIGGCAHLVNFRGSDTMSAMEVARVVYGDDNVANTIPAAEHGTITAWGEAFEFEAFRNMITQFGESGSGLVAVVSDSYDLFHAVKELWGKQLRQMVLNASNILVVRPDSGVPHEIVRQTVEDLDLNYGHTINSKGFKVLNKVRVIQGDGINLEEVQRILNALEVRGWSADNIAFGMGGALLQRMDRDTNRFAIKASQVTVDGQVRNIRKSPVTDNSKRSKAGRLKLVQDEETGIFSTIADTEIGFDLLSTVYEDGCMYQNTLFSDVRRNAMIHSTTPTFI